MIKNYADLIQSLVNSFSGNTTEFGWSDFSVLMTNTCMLVGILLSCTLGSYLSLWKLPVSTYVSLTKSLTTKLDAIIAVDNPDYEEFDKVKKQLRFRRLIYWFLFICAYIPFILPCLLMLVNVLF